MSLFFISSPLWNGFKRCQSYRLQPDSCLVFQISPQNRISTTLHLYFFSSLATFVCECIHSVHWGHKDFHMLSMFIKFEYAVVAIFWVDFVVWWSHRLIISVSLEYTYIHTNINVRPKASKAHVCFEQFKKFFLRLTHLFFSVWASTMCKQDLEVYCIL